MKILNKILKDLSVSEEENIMCDSPLMATGITMGGPVPEQVSLDWDFHFQNTHSST